MRNVKSGSDVHVRLPDEASKRLQVIAEFHNQPASAMAALLLEIALAGEWHKFTLVQQKLNAMGTTGIVRE